MIIIIAKIIFKQMNVDNGIFLDWKLNLENRILTKIIWKWDFFINKMIIIINIIAIMINK